MKVSVNKKTRPTLELRTTLGCLRSIKPNMINHFVNQSQTCQLLKKLFFNIEYQIILVDKWFYCCQSIQQNPCRLSRGLYRYMFIDKYQYLGFIFLTSLACVQVYGKINLQARRIFCLENVAKFTGWAIIEVLSIRGRVGIFLVSWGHKRVLNAVVLIYRDAMSSGLQ